MEWMILPLKRYFDFRGRSRRKEYWMYTLFVFLVTIVLTILDDVLGLGGSVTGETDLSGTSVAASGVMSGGWLTNIFALATFIPGIAVLVRRLHDIDRTGWWVLALFGLIVIGSGAMGFGMAQSVTSGSIGAVGILGIAALIAGIVLGIVMLVWACTAGTSGPNRFGEDPLGQGTNAEEVFG